MLLLKVKASGEASTYGDGCITTNNGLAASMPQQRNKMDLVLLTGCSSLFTSDFPSSRLRLAKLPYHRRIAQENDLAVPFLY